MTQTMECEILFSNNENGAIFFVTAINVTFGNQLSVSKAKIVADEYLSVNQLQYGTWQL